MKGKREEEKHERKEGGSEGREKRKKGDLLLIDLLDLKVKKSKLPDWLRQSEVKERRGEGEQGGRR